MHLYVLPYLLSPPSLPLPSLQAKLLPKELTECEDFVNPAGKVSILKEEPTPTRCVGEAVYLEMRVAMEVRGDEETWR